MQATNTKYINRENWDFYLTKINKNKKKNHTNKTPLSNKTNFDNPDPVPLDFLNLELFSA